MDLLLQVIEEDQNNKEVEQWILRVDRIDHKQVMKLHKWTLQRPGYEFVTYGKYPPYYEVKCSKDDVGMLAKEFSFDDVKLSSECPMEDESADYLKLKLRMVK